jgi:serine/threonine protein kinase
MQMKGEVDVNDDAGLEKEADIMGAKAMSSESLEPVGEKRQSQTSDLSTVQRLIKVKSDASKIRDDLAKYVKERVKLKSATPGASGKVELGKATATLAEEVVADESYIAENDRVVLKEVIIPLRGSIRTEEEEEGGDPIPLEALMPGKLNAEGDGDTATTTYATIQVMERGVIKRYYLIMEYAEGGDQAHRDVKKAELETFNAHAKKYYEKLEVIFTELAKSGFNSGDIKPANIFLTSADLPMLGDFGDYTVGEYRRKNQDITDLMNDLMKTSGLKKTYGEIKAWAADKSLWTPVEAPATPVAEIPVVLPQEEAVKQAVVGQEE